ncbi:MAG: HIT domain-containing protein [Bacteriovoracaceae bacterium]|nr:HIT domain-containing protein [Bacteriovoracaceae bacterium]
MSFELHPQLEKDLISLGKLDLCQAFLLPDSDNPWVVLVPEIPNIREVHELSKDDQYKLMDEISLISKKMESKFSPDKLNVAALGNMVPQLHIHIICRYKGDKSWPGSLFGSVPGEDKKKIESYKEELQLQN